MQQFILGLLLDDGGREAVRLLSVVTVVVLLGLMVVLAVPVALLVGPTSGVAGSRVTSPAGARSEQPAPAVAAGVAPSTSQASSDMAPPASGSVEVARRYLGVRYVFGGTDPRVGLDCSGLVQLVFRQLGIVVPRTAQQQFEATARVPREDLQPGDLVFFARTYADPHDWITHVGIYVGGGMQINAPTEGQVVSVQPVFSGFWGAHFAGAGRVRHT